MLQIRIIALGKAKAGFISAGNKEYLKRLQPYAKTELVILPAKKIPAKPNLATTKAIKDQEAELIATSIRPNEYLIALDEKGRQYTSTGFANHLEKLMLQGNSRIAFLIGGTLGLSPSILERANATLSLSSLTFTHELARLILLEQIYRAFKINAGEPYHY